jgi:hypothetical protein
MAKVGRPKKSGVLSLDDILDEDGNPLNPNEQSKDTDARDFKKAVEARDYNERTNGRGMYAGMANPESYFEFYKTSIGKKRRGRPWTYPTAEALQSEITAYFEFCIDKRVPVTVAGLGAWLGVTTSTLRLWKQNKDTMPFYEVVEPAIGFIHAMTEQGAMDGTVPVVAYIFSSKNYHGLQDKTEYEILPTQQLTSLEQDEILKQLPE